jgi:hypothetical protein
MLPNDLNQIKITKKSTSNCADEFTQVVTPTKLLVIAGQGPVMNKQWNLP